MSTDYTTWPTERLVDEAMNLLQEANILISKINANCEFTIARLKAADYSMLNEKDKHLLDSQLAHEAKAKMLGWI